VPGNVVIAETSATLELIQAGFGIAVVGRWVIEPQLRAGTLRAVRITRRGVWCSWNAIMLKELAGTPHVRDFVALVGRELRCPLIRPRSCTEITEKHGGAEVTKITRR
jgi:DNA-binding transcriptional LysR family regulator